MNLLKLFLLCFSFPFLLNASNSLTDLSSEVLNEIESIFYSDAIVGTISNNESLFPLLSYTEELKILFRSYPDKNKSELYEIAFQKLEKDIKAIGEFDKPYSTDIYTEFQKFVVGHSPALKEVAGRSKRSLSGDIPEFSRLSSVGSIDLNTLGSLEFDDILRSYSADLFSTFNNGIPLPAVGFLLEPSKPVKPSLSSPSFSKRTYNEDLAAKKWALAAGKISRFHSKVYNFVNGLTDKSEYLKFFGSVVIHDNLMKIFIKNSNLKRPFFDRSIADLFNTELSKFVEALDVKDQITVGLFIASIMEFGNEIYKEIKDEIKETDDETELLEHENKRKRLEPGISSPIDISTLVQEYFSIAEEFNIKADEHLNIASSSKTVKHDIERRDEEDKEEKEEKEAEEDDLPIASPEELEQPDTVAFLDAPFESLQEAISTSNSKKFDEIRAVYYGLVDRDFESLGEDTQVFLASILDNALGKVFFRK